MNEILEIAVKKLEMLPLRPHNLHTKVHQDGVPLERIRANEEGFAEGVDVLGEEVGGEGG